jgi:ectoine hydroxylase-related dioxygenase (phytanoyl-CoA dioxygenase family)
MINTDHGFFILGGVFASSDMRHALQGLAVTDLARTEAGARHILSVPLVHKLACDPRMVRIAQQLVGAGATPFRATLFDKSGLANWLVAWHQDTALPLRSRIEHPDWGPWSTKGGVFYAHAPAWALEQVIALRVSLDDSWTTNGPLRVLPHTHRHGVLSESLIEQLARETTAVDCLTAAGGVVAMRPLTVHASSKATDDRPRRVLHIEYAPTVRLAPGIELAVV